MSYSYQVQTFGCRPDEHCFVWVSGDGMTEPPAWTLCLCGQYQYGQWQELQDQGAQNVPAPAGPPALSPVLGWILLMAAIVALVGVAS